MWMRKLKIRHLLVRESYSVAILAITTIFCYIIIIFLVYNLPDAAKRKQLPAWIREGLEKMERDKRRKIEQEQDIEPNYSSFTNENIIQELPNV